MATSRPSSTRPTPNRTFILLALLSSAVLAAIVWSTHHLLLAGAPTAVEGIWPGVGCLFLPTNGDLAPHAASYAFLVALIAGCVSGTRAVLHQQRRTHALLRACRAGLSLPDNVAEVAARTVGIGGRFDVLDAAEPLAFCYGYLQPRVLMSRGLVALLTFDELSALLIHEREHLRQRDPMKVAVGRLMTSAVFFVPAVGALYRRYLVEKELAADAAAIAAQASSVSLASALAVFLELPHETRPEAATGAEEALDARIDALLGEPVRLGPRLSRVRLLASAIAAVLVIVPLVLAPPPAAATLVGHAVSDCHVVSAAQIAP
jgi:Zn-dependent protease with chaperone function